MAMKFEYDENGAKFVYFVLAFYAMVLIPITYFFWPKKTEKKLSHPEDLSCFEPCLKKAGELNKDAPRKTSNNRIM
jgi:translocation protein SEC63